MVTLLIIELLAYRLARNKVAGAEGALDCQGTTSGSISSSTLKQQRYLLASEAAETQGNIR